MRKLCLFVYVTEVFWVLVTIALFTASNTVLTAILFSIESQTEISDNAAISDFRAWVEGYKANHSIKADNPLFQEIDDACASATAENNNWSFEGTTFFLVTVATTIGYGIYTPTSFGAQLLISIFCIPLFLLMLKSYLTFSKALVMAIKFCLARLFCDAKAGDDSSQIRKSGSIEMLRQNTEDLEEEESSPEATRTLDLLETVEECKKWTKEEDDDCLDPKLMHKLLVLFATPDAKVAYPAVKRVFQSHFAPEERVKKILKQTSDHDKFTLPIAIVIVLVYVLVSAGVESAEARANGIDLDHGFWTAIWYTIITTTTIGLGDYTPQSFGKDRFNTLWLYLGLGSAVLFIDLLSGILSRCTKKEYKRCKNKYFDFDGATGKITNIGASEEE